MIPCSGLQTLTHGRRRLRGYGMLSSLVFLPEVKYFARYAIAIFWHLQCHRFPCKFFRFTMTDFTAKKAKIMDRPPKIRHSMTGRGSPIPLLKTASRKSDWPFHGSRKIRKAASRSQKKASNHVSRKNTNHIHVVQNVYKYNHYKTVFKHFSGFSRSKCVYFSLCE